VSGRLRVGTLLAPTRHAAEYELRVASEAVVRADAEPLHHAGPEALDERVGLLDQFQQRLDAIGVLQIDADRASSPSQQVATRGRVVRRAVANRLRAVDSDHLGPHVGEQHGGERSRADARDLDDAIPA
jgi:hypothetical protein